jgi:small-conductance mechanosensitive channel
MYSWLVFLHVLGIFGFLIAHGVSASVFFALKNERNEERICTLLQLSSSSARVLLISLLTLLFSGIIAGFVGHWWRYGWIWLSLFLLIAIYAGMSLLGTRILNEVRLGVGLPSAYGQPPRQERFNVEELDARLERIHPYRLTWIGFGGLVLIAWLMMFKPF